MRENRARRRLSWAIALTSALIATAPPATSQRAPAVQCDRSKLKIALDVGHDLTHPGATSARGNTEFSYNLALAQLTLTTLQSAGFTSAFLIGQSGAPIRLAQRSGLATAAGAALFISLHHDSVQKQYFTTWHVDGRALPYSDAYRGYSIFVSATSSFSRSSLAFATDLGRALRTSGLTPSLHHAEPIPGESRQLLDASLGLYEFGQLAVLRKATMPALLLEAGVIVHRDEEKSIQSGQLHPKIAASLLTAIAAFCNRAQAPR